MRCRPWDKRPSLQPVIALPLPSRKLKSQLRCLAGNYCLAKFDMKSLINITLPVNHDSRCKIFFVNTSYLGCYCHFVKLKKKCKIE